MAAVDSEVTDPEKCTTQSAQNVARTAKSHSSLEKASQYTAATASKQSDQCKLSVSRLLFYFYFFQFFLDFYQQKEDDLSVGC